MQKQWTKEEDDYLRENYATMGKIGEAYKIVTMSLAKNPDNPGAHRALGLIYMYQRRWDMAQREYEKVLAYIPDDYKTLIDLGHVYFNLGKLDNAEEMIKRGRRLAALK